MEYEDKSSALASSPSVVERVIAPSDFGNPFVATDLETFSFVDGCLNDDYPLDFELLSELPQPAVPSAGAVLNSKKDSESCFSQGANARKWKNMPKCSPEEIRRRRAARQAEYRKRGKSDLQNAQAMLGSKADEIKALMDEREDLTIRSSVLKAMLSYSESVITCFSDLVQRMPKPDISAACHFANSLVEMTLAKALCPSDNLIKQIIASRTIEELEAMTLTGQSHVADLFLSWETNVCSRNLIESHITFRQDFRKRAIMLLTKEFPQIGLELIRRVVVPLGPDGRPNIVMRQAVEGLELQPWQRAGMRNQFSVYKAEVNASRELARAALGHTVGLMTTERCTDGIKGASGMAGHFLSNMEAVSDLDAYPIREGVLLLNLFAEFADILSPVQKGRLALQCKPHLADPLQLCTILFEESD